MSLKCKIDDAAFYTDLVNKTKEVTITTIQKVASLADFNRILLLASLSDLALNDLGFTINEAKIRLALDDYDPKKIVKEGKYVDLLNKLLKIFPPEKKSACKKLAQAITLSSHYLCRYQDMTKYETKLKLVCVDMKTTEKFLDDFRKTSGIFGMYFNKASLVFQTSGLLDVPFVNKAAKELIMKEYDLEDNNTVIYEKLLKIAATNKVSCNELNMRINAIK
jgi:hypothetical protein